MIGGEIHVTNNHDSGCTYTGRFEIARPPAVSGQQPAGTPGQLPNAPVAGSPLRILLAEDNHVNQLVAVKLLNKRGHSVRVVSNGSQAIQAFQEEQFDAILMDVQMPDMDGYEVTAAIRQLEAGSAARVPIIALTAHAITGIREICAEAGMDGYVSKPIRIADLMAELEAVREPAAAVG
jgi:CheY-like chemotaxis protein